VEVGLVGRRVWENCYERSAELRNSLFLVASDAIRQSTVTFPDSPSHALSELVLLSLSPPELVELQVVFALRPRLNRSLAFAEICSSVVQS